jgi:hypothetical protein
VFTGPLPSSRRPIVARVGFSGNVFTESLPRSESIHQNMIKYRDNFTLKTSKFNFQSDIIQRNVVTISKLLKLLDQIKPYSIFQPCPMRPFVLSLNLTYIFVFLSELSWTNLPCIDFLHSTCRISCPFSLAYFVYPKNSFKSEDLCDNS